RVDGILTGRGFNIDSLVAANAEAPDKCRMTIVSRGQDTTNMAVLNYTETIIVEREMLLSMNNWLQLSI
ncbi:7128_t:CDS:2, partial [Entrophospora sp. SA101]